MTTTGDFSTSRALRTLLALSCVACGWWDVVNAQIVTDGSLGAQTSLGGSIVTISPTLGQQQGANLFHSFSAFNVNALQSARFDSVAGTTNIVARVTGGTASQINGTLIANANLFLLNPNGVVFGGGATLNINGAFHASTADYLRLNDGARFYAALSQTSTLTAAPPAAFGFLDGSVGAISLTNATLRSPTAGTVSLVGGDVTLTNSHVIVQQGRFNLAAVASAGEVDLGAMNATGFTAMGNIRFNNSQVNSDGFQYLETAQSVYIRGGRFVLENQSGIVGNTTLAGAARTIDINVDSLQINPLSGIDIEAANSGASTNAIIRAREIDVRGDSQTDPSGILLAGGGVNPSGNLTIVTDRLSASGPGALIGTGVVQSVGRAGNLTIQARTIEIADDAALIAISVGVGAGGFIDISTDTLSMRQRASIQSGNYGAFFGFPAGGNSGPILIRARTVSLADHAAIIAANLSSGNAGSITIQTIDAISLSNSSAISTAASAGTGGNIQLAANNSILLRESTISTNVQGAFGNGGNIDIDPTYVVIDNSRILASAVGGNGGNINITGQYVLQSANSVIDASSQLGVSGRVDIVGVDVDLNSEIVQLPTDFLNAKQWLATPCASRLGADITQFTVTGRDGAFHSPADLLASPMDFDVDGAAATRVLGSNDLLATRLRPLSFRPLCLQGPG